MSDTLRLIGERRGDALVVSTMTGTQGWNEVTSNEAMALPMGGAMGKASSLALGLCLARPDKRVILIDGDGSLLMNLGALVTVAGSMPHNLYHIPSGQRSVRRHGRPAHSRRGRGQLHGDGSGRELQRYVRLPRPGGPGDPHRRVPGTQGPRPGVHQDRSGDRPCASASTRPLAPDPRSYADDVRGATPVEC